MLTHLCIADYDSNRLFWVDAKLHVIFTSDFNGQNRQVVLTSYNNLKHPFSVAVFEVNHSLHLTSNFVCQWHHQPKAGDVLELGRSEVTGCTSLM